jgi:hypothetical protein
MRALQATIGNAAVARVMAGPRALQRMKFERFERYGFATNWGSYNNDENNLLKAEAALATYIKGLETWATADNQIKALLADFVALEQSTMSQSQYNATGTRIKRLERELHERRAALLNENPSRTQAPDPTFTNKDPKALVGEIQQFLGRLGLERKQERDRGVPVESFRIVIPVPGEHQATQHAIAESASDEALEGALLRSITERRARLQEKLESYGTMNWTYSTDGLLSVGSTQESKHPVVGAGADVWAAGTVKLKRTEGENVFLSYKVNLEKAKGYEEQIKTLAAKDPRLTDLRIAKRTYEAMAEHDKEAYERLGFDPDRDVVNLNKTVEVDFDSGHYQPSEAWRRSASAWRSLGYNVEWNPLGRTA